MKRYIVNIGIGNLPKCQAEEHMLKIKELFDGFFDPDSKVVYFQIETPLEPKFKHSYKSLCH